MRNMSMLKRLINGFKRQDKVTIWSHLDTLAEDPAVYSEHLIGLGPKLENHHIYIYIDHWCVVVVCLDNEAHKDELADEEGFGGDEPLYFTADSHRVSPVWLLSETLKLIRQKLLDNKLEYYLRGVLLSESNFINADDMKPFWDEEMGITVIDKLEDMSQHLVFVNNDEEHLAGTMAMKAIEDMVQRPEAAAKEEKEDDFEQLLSDFIEKMNLEKVPEEEEGMMTDESAEEEEEAEGEETEDTTSEEPEDEGLDLPSGFIEQNGAVSVNVQVLPPMKNPRAELDKLVGCQDIKRRLDELLALTRYNKMMREAFPDAKAHEVSLHSIFFGRPGTGKTTVCKIFGSLLREAGVLSKGHVLVANRGTFIGTLWGDEERSVQQVLEQARGGVLMIDEAYLLSGKNEHDPGRLVIQLLMEVLADEKQRDIAVVLCGYKEPMLKLLDSNPGLQSRFPNRFEFDDFTVDELLEIAHRRVGEYQYRFTDSAWQKLREVLTSAYSVRDPQSWGNARFVANQLERIYLQHAQRCVRECPSDKEQLLWLTPADITPIEVARARPRIGF